MDKRLKNRLMCYINNGVVSMKRYPGRTIYDIYEAKQKRTTTIDCDWEQMQIRYLINSQCVDCMNLRKKRPENTIGFADFCELTKTCYQKIKMKENILQDTQKMR